MTQARGAAQTRPAQMRMLYLEPADQRGERISLPSAESAALTLVAGRSQECAIRLADELVSRQHFVLRSSPLGWQLSDLDSHNGTFVNGRRLQHAERWTLSPEDHITAGGLAWDVQTFKRSNVPTFQRDHRDPAWRWAVLASGALAVGLLLASAFSPWVRIEAKLTLANIPGGEIIAGGARIVQGIVQAVLGTPQPAGAAQPAQTTFRLLEQTVSGMDTPSYGLAVLGVAIAAAVSLVLDLAFVPARRGAFGLAYLLLGLAPGVLFLSEYARFDQLARQPVLFGIDVAALFKASQQLVDIQVTPLIGIWLLGAGLLLLLITAILRMVFPAKG